MFVNRQLTAMAMACLLTACGAGSATPPRNIAPTVTLTTPARDVEVGASRGGTVDITYSVHDPDDDASTDLFADQDGDPTTTGDQVVIARDLPEKDGAVHAHAWDVRAVPPGRYRIVAVSRDGSRTAVDTAPGRVVVNAVSTLTIVEPAADVRLSRGAHLGVSYIDDDPDDVALTWLALDRDGIARTAGPDDVVTHGLPEGDGAQQRAFIDVGSSLGTFSVLGSTWDGTNEVASAVAPGRVTFENVAWARSCGWESGAVATASDGSWVVTGYAGPGAVFGEGEPTEMTTSTRGLFVARYRADGSLAWVTMQAVPLPGSGGARKATGVAVAPDGSIRVCGIFASSAVFDPGLPTEQVLPAAGLDDSFVARFSEDGVLVWVRHIASTSYDWAHNVSATPDGSTVCVGHQRARVVYGAGETHETTIDGRAGFAAVYAEDGSLRWARAVGDETVADVATGPDGSMVFTGALQEEAIFGPGEPGETTVSTDAVSELFLARYERDGAMAWVRTTRSSSYGRHHGLGIDLAPDGSILVSGFIAQWRVVFGEGEPNETTLTPGGALKLVVARYESDGTLRWVRDAASSESSRGSDIAAMADGSCVVAVTATAAVTLHDGTRLDWAGRPSANVIRYRPDGSVQWARVFPATGAARAARVAVGPRGSILMDGSYNDSMVFGAGLAGETTLTAAGPVSRNGFIAELNADGGF